MAAAYRDCDIASVVRRDDVANSPAPACPRCWCLFPFAVDDHQTGNAEFSLEPVRPGLVQQKELTAEKSPR